MVNKTNKVIEIPFSLQKILVIAGLGVMIFTLVATLFTLFSGQIYIRDALSLSYYGRYAVTVVGGFGGGLLLAYLSSRRLSSAQASKSIIILTGITFGLLAFSLWLILDPARLWLRELYGDPEYPWSRVLFEGLPVAALVLVSIFAFVSYLKGVVISVSKDWFQKIFIGVFLLLQVVYLSSVGYIWSGAELSASSLIIGLVGLIATPLVVAAIVFFVIGRALGTVVRVYSAAAIGLIYQLTVSVTWEFHISPNYQESLDFSSAVTLLAFLLAVALAMISRYVIRSNK